MNEDVADGLLLDVREVSLADLRLDEESSLAKALCRLLALNVNSYNSFGSSI